MKVMVIGSGGFLGRHLCRRLGSDGAQTVEASSTDGTGIDPRSGLLPASFAVPSGTDAVIYLAQSPQGTSSPQEVQHLLQVNSIAPVQAALLAQKAGVKRFLYASTGTVYVPSRAPLRETDPVRRDGWYALSKVHAEEALALCPDLDVTCLRIFGLYGPGQTGRLVPNLIAAVAQERVITLERPGAELPADGGLHISLMHVDDAARTIAALLSVSNLPVVNLGGDEAVDIRTMALAIGEVIGMAPRFSPAIQPRQGDLVADLGLLSSRVPTRFVQFANGIIDVVRHSIAAKV